MITVYDCDCFKLLFLSEIGNVNSLQSCVYDYDFSSLFLAKIRNMNSVAMWIGVNDLGVEGRFVWTDGSPVAYLHWGNGKVKVQKRFWKVNHKVKRGRVW